MPRHFYSRRPLLVAIACLMIVKIVVSIMMIYDRIEHHRQNQEKHNEQSRNGI